MPHLQMPGCLLPGLSCPVPGCLTEHRHKEGKDVVNGKQHWHSKQLFAAASWHRGQDTIDTDVHVYFTTLMHILCIWTQELNVNAASSGIRWQFK
jgi:hypothetical protein